MKAIVALLGLLASRAVAGPPAAQVWTGVAAPGAQSPGIEVSVAPPPSEADITLVGATPVRPLPYAAALPVVAIDLDAPPKAASPATSARAEPEPLPPSTRWPDPSGRISDGPQSAAADAKPRLRNPWEVRSAQKGSSTEQELMCGGVIIGGEGGPVAFLNGRPVRRGDSVGRYGVARVLASGVLLERNGAYFFAPIRLRVVVETRER